MKPMALFVITADPRSSGQTVEAIRIAVGVAAWKRVEVAVYLSGPAVLAAGEDVDDLVEAENLERYTPLLRDLGRPVYIDAAFPAGLREARVPVQTLDARELAELATQSSYVLRF